LLVLILSFPSDIKTEVLNNKIDEVKKAIRGKYPKINYIIIQPD